MWRGENNGLYTYDRQVRKVSAGAMLDVARRLEAALDGGGEKRLTWGKNVIYSPWMRRAQDIYNKECFNHG